MDDDPGIPRAPDVLQRVAAHGGYVRQLPRSDGAQVLARGERLCSIRLKGLTPRTGADYDRIQYGTTIMTRLASVIDPSRQPATARLAYETVRKAEAMGLVRETAPTDAIDLRQLQRVVAAIRAARIGEPTRIDLARASPRELARHLEKLSEALEESPVPEHEWRRLGAIVEPDQLARLLSISTSSVRRYLRGARATPDEVAARLHLLALVVGDLLGAYNEIGVRRWFERRRTQLGDRTPAELLAGNWKPEDPGPRQVRALARSLVGSPAT